VIDEEPHRVLIPLNRRFVKNARRAQSAFALLVRWSSVRKRQRDHLEAAGLTNAETDKGSCTTFIDTST